LTSQNNTAASQSMTGKFVNVLVIGGDLTFARAVQSALQTLQANQPDVTFRVFPGASKEKIKEYIEKYTLHSVLVEEDSIDTVPDPWLKEFRETLKKTTNNAETPVILVTSKTDLVKTRNRVFAGYMDLIVKPLDPTLFLQKMNMYNKKIPISDDSLLFSLETSQDVDVGFYYKTKSVSEYGIKVISNKPIELDSIVTIYASFAEENMAAIVKEVSKIADDQYFVFMMFIGISPAQTQSIRKFIRVNYAEEKQAR
jgi:hypothetical protein